MVRLPSFQSKFAVMMIQWKPWRNDFPHTRDRSSTDEKASRLIYELCSWLIVTRGHLKVSSYHRSRLHSQKLGEFKNICTNFTSVQGRFLLLHSSISDFSHNIPVVWTERTERESESVCVCLVFTCFPKSRCMNCLFLPWRGVSELEHDLRRLFFTVLEAILTKSFEKLQCFYEKLMLNNFRENPVLKKKYIYKP